MGWVRFFRSAGAVVLLDLGSARGARQPPSSDPTPAARPPRWPWVPRQCGFQEEHGAADGDKGDAELQQLARTRQEGW